jgi:hypothetical protein
LTTPQAQLWWCQVIPRKHLFKHNCHVGLVQALKACACLMPGTAVVGQIAEAAVPALIVWRVKVTVMRSWFSATACV